MRRLSAGVCVLFGLAAVVGRARAAGEEEIPPGGVATPTAVERADARPGFIEVRLAPVLGAENGGFVSVPSNDADTASSVGLAASVGVLVTRYFEPGLTVAGAVGHQTIIRGPAAHIARTDESFSLVPFLKLNLWRWAHVNPFLEPFAGVTYQNFGDTPVTQGDHYTYLYTGLDAGLELLLGRFGVRIWTGAEFLVGDRDSAFVFPLRWALVGYFGG